MSSANTFTARTARSSTAASAARLLCGVVLAVVASASMAQDATADKARYEKDRAACLNGTSQEDKATCLKESGAVLQERKEGKIQATPKDPTMLQQNALQRCGNVSAKDRADCETRAKGEGKTQGSVNGGGVIKETVTTTVLPRGASVPEGSTQVGTIPGAVIPAPPSFASAPRQ